MSKKKRKHIMVKINLYLESRCLSPTIPISIFINNNNNTNNNNNMIATLKINK